MKLHQLVVLLISVFIQSILTVKKICPREDPKSSECLSSLTQEDCPPDTFIVPGNVPESVCGHCPGCLGGITDNETFCTTDRPCAPGLNCEEGKCQLDKSKCSYTYHLKGFQGLPTCEIDGTFAAVQCKGDRVTGRCFCYSPDGHRIPGWAWWRRASDMTCACSRLKHRMNQEKNLHNTLHCDKIGNFEPLQCNDGVCWCADPKTGKVMKGTRAVAESMWTNLPCYDIAKTGMKYLRQCESAAYAQHLMKEELLVHGTTKAEYNSIQCDFDGAYGIYVIQKGVAYCQWRDGSRLAPFQAPSSKVAEMNCNCVRDQKIFEEEGLEHRLSCGENGNYKNVQEINGKIFCVDSDGFSVKDAEETTVIPDCIKFLYYNATEFGQSDFYKIVTNKTLS